MTNESRIIKESTFIAKNLNFEKIILLGIYSAELEKEQYVDMNIFIKRYSFFSIKNRRINYLYYYFISFILLLYLRPKMVNIHTLELLPLALVAKVLGSKVIYDTHELETEKANFGNFRKKVSKILERIFIKFTDKTIVVGDAIKENYKKEYPLIDVSVVLNTPFYRETVKKDIFRKKFSIPEDKSIFLYQGGFFPSRGIKQLIDIFKQSDEVIVFMGYGPLDSLILKASCENKNIFFHKAVSPDVLYEYTSSADFGFCMIEGICRSYEFCMPNKMFEYMMAGVPVIASRLPEMEKFISENQIGLLVDYNDKITLLNTINEIKKSNLSILKNNIEHTKRKFNWESQQKILKKVYDV